MTDHFLHRWAPGVLLIAVFGLFLHTLPYHFVYDDHWTVVNNKALNNVSPIGRFFSDPNTVAVPESGMQKDIYRPIQTLSFALNKNLFGSNPQSFRLVNILLHFANGLLLFLLLKRKGPLWISVLGSLIFLCHPVQVESVVWISQRSILICTLGILGSLLIWDIGNKKYLRWIYPIFILALLGKETALMLPFLLLGWPTKKKVSKTGPLLTLFIIAGGFYVCRGIILGTVSQSKPLVDPLLIRMGEGLMALGLYIKNIIWPFDLNVSYQWPSQAPSSYAEFWCGFILVVTGIFCLIKTKKKYPVLFSGLLVFFLFWFPHSGITPLVTFAADRFLYLPMIGIALLAVFTFQKFPQVPIASLLVVILFIISANRTFAWETDRSLWAASVKTNPENPFAQFCLGQEALKNNDFDVAKSHLEKSLDLKATVPVALGALKLLARIGEIQNDFEAQRTWSEKLTNLQSKLQ